MKFLENGTRPQPPTSHRSTLQGLLDWVEVVLGFTKLLFMQTALCVVCVLEFCTIDVFGCIIPHTEGGGGQRKIEGGGEKEMGGVGG